MVIRPVEGSKVISMDGSDAWDFNLKSEPLVDLLWFRLWRKPTESLSLVDPEYCPSYDADWILADLTR